MQDRFDYRTYWSIVGRLARTHRPVRFADLRAGMPPTPFFILRHDVDYSTAAALRLAAQEARRGVRASYFLLTGGPYYNLLGHAHADVPARLVDLGHEVGLHYDVRFFRAFDRARWRELLAAQAELLGRLSGVPVISIAMHQPALHGGDPFRDTRYLNAYDHRFCGGMAYVSDSCRAWRDATWDVLDGGAVPARLQLLLHPVNWAAQDRTRTRIFREVHAELRDEVTRSERELMGQIARHSGVLEHEARRRRARAGARRSR